MTAFSAGMTPGHAQSIDYGSLEALFGEPVTTSVTGSPQRASDVPGSMIIVTADEIRRSGARDIPGVLRHVPGVDVLQWTNDAADVAVRGYNQAFSPRLLVLVNGRQVYSDFYTFTAWSTLPVELSDIRQIEIVMGPNSALFGFNAVGGVINILTYDPLYDDVNSATIRGGTQNLVQGSAIATFKLGKTAGLRVSLGGRQNDDFSTRQRSSDVGTRFGDKRKAVDILAHARLWDAVDASLEISHSESRETAVTPLYSTYFMTYRATSIQARLATDTGVGILQATAYANWDKGTALSPNPAIPVYYLNNPTYVVQLQDIFKIANAHTFRLSAEYRRADMASTPLAGAHVHYNVAAIGAMWNWTIAPDLSFANAVRIDHLSLGRTGLIPVGVGLKNGDWNRRSLTEISFNSGIVWKADDDDTLRLTVGRGVQLPNLLDLGGLLFAFPPFGYASGVPTLKPTIVMNYELGWDRALPNWNAKLAVRAFHETTRDITSDTAGTIFSKGIIYAPINIGRSAAWGLELSLSGTYAEDWRWGLSYTPELVNDNFSAGYTATSRTLVNYEKTNPIHVVTANLGWTHGAWDVDGFLRYKSRFYSIQGDGQLMTGATLASIAGYTSVDARIAYRITDNVTLALSGQNLLNSPQKQTSAAAVERQVFVTANVSF